MKNDTLFSSTERLNICKRLWIFVFTKNKGRNIGKNVSKNLSSKYHQKLLVQKDLKLLQKEQFKKQWKQMVI